MGLQPPARLGLGAGGVLPFISSLNLHMEFLIAFVRTYASFLQFLIVEIQDLSPLSRETEEFREGCLSSV